MDKICGICHQDCSDRPRVKDQRGRYFCKACAAAHAGRAAPAPAPASQPVAQADTQPDEHPYALDDADPGSSPLPIELLDHVERSTPCPACMHSMPPGAKVCVACGYHVEKGIQSSTQIEKTKTKRGRKYQCRECGYDLRGLRSGVCPECGTRIKLTKEEERERIARDVLKEEWRKPGIYFAVGAGGLALFHTILGQPEALVGYAILLAAQILVGYAVLWLCFSFLGDIGTPLLNLVRLASIYVVVDLIGVFVGFIPIFIIPFVIKLLAYIGLFSDAFDTDWQDAFLVIFLTWLAKVALLLIAVFYIPQLFP